MRQIWRVLQFLWDTGNYYIRLAIVLVLGWPIVMTLAKLDGISGDATIALALMPAGALVLLLLVIPPMLPVLLVSLPTQPFNDIWLLRRVRFPSRTERLRALRRVLKFLTLIAGIELAIGVYLAGVPVGNDPGLILWLLAITVVFVLMWYGGIRRRWLTRVFVVAFLVITFLFFFGGREGARRLSGQAKQSVSQVQTPGVQASQTAVSSLDSVKEIVRIPLLGEGMPSEKALLLPGMIPPLWYYYFEGSPQAQVHYDDGTVGPITKWFGMKGGSLKFSGPKGQEVIVKAFPPG